MGIPLRGRNGGIGSSSEGDVADPSGSQSPQCGALFVRPDQLELLRRLTMNDEAALARVVSGGDAAASTHLDERTISLVRLTAVVTLGAAAATLHAAVDRARAAGIDDQEILEAVLSVSTIIGTLRLDTALSQLLMVMNSD